MSEPSPLIIVSLPYRSIAEIRAVLPELRAAGAGAAEVRVDRLDPGEVDRLPELFPSPLALVGTLRSRAEGGSGPDAPEERAQILRLLQTLPFEYLDLELARDSALFGEADDAVHRPTRILSRHYGPTDDLTDLGRRLQHGPADGELLKLVVPAPLGRLYSEIRPLLMGGPERLRRTIVHTTGPSGPILRARAGALGMPAVYAAPPQFGPGPGGTVEPSQVPVDGLAPYLRAASPGRLYGLIGHPVAHSVSPKMHTRWYVRLGLPGLFVALDVESATEFRGVLGPLHDDGFYGFNVTHPWKEEALGAARAASESAAAAGCANTLTWEDGAWSADNFDVDAVLRRMGELSRSGLWNGQDLLVLGAGGAARAALAAARRAGAHARVLARRAEAAQRLAREFGAEVETQPERHASLLIHATPVGRAGAAILDLAWAGHVGPSTYFLDFVYRPDHPDLAERVRALGAKYEDGGRLLVYQALEVHRRWWGAAPSAALESEALAEVGCAV